MKAAPVVPFGKLKRFSTKRVWKRRPSCWGRIPFTAALAAWAAGKSCGELKYDMDLEKKSFELKKKFNLGKQTNLTNCK